MPPRWPCAANCAANCYLNSTCDGVYALPGELCASCAGTATEREACGSVEDKRATDTVCPNLDFCHAGLAGNANCTECVDWVLFDCRGKQLPGSERLFECCISCPAGYDQNDKPCNYTTDFGPRNAPGCGKSPDCQ